MSVGGDDVCDGLWWLGQTRWFAQSSGGFVGLFYLLIFRHGGGGRIGREHRKKKKKKKKIRVGEEDS